MFWLLLYFLVKICRDPALTFFLSFALVKITYTLHILANMAPKAVVKPSEASHIRAWAEKQY